MKRKLALLLAMMSVCMFASCGDSDDDKSSSSSESSSVSESSDESESSENSDKEDESSDKDESEDESSVKDESSDDDEKSEASEDEEDSSEVSESESSESGAESSDGSFTLGTVENGVYTSEFSGLSFTAPDNMSFASEEEILEMMNLGADLLDDSRVDLYMELAKQTTVYDMVASDPTTGDNVMVMYENLSTYGSSADYDVDTYVAALEAQMDMMASSGLTYTKKSSGTVNLSGMDFAKVEFEATYDTYGYTTTQTYYVAKQDDYIIAVITTLGMMSDVEDASVYEQYFS